jgi:WD40 repeat protein
VHAGGGYARGRRSKSRWIRSTIGRIWPLSPPRLVTTTPTMIRVPIVVASCTIYALAASLDGKLFATGDRDGNIRVWQASDGKRLHEMQVDGLPVYGLAFHPDGQRLISADRQPKKPRLKVWEFATGKEQRNIDVPQLSTYRRVEDIEWGGIRGMTISPDGNTLVACGSHEYSGPACALLFDLATGELKRKLTSTLKGFYYSAPFHAQGFLLTAGGDIGKGKLRTWDPSQDESIANINTPGPCTSLDIHPGGASYVLTQMVGKSSYPDSGSLTLHDWP